MSRIVHRAGLYLQPASSSAGDAAGRGHQLPTAGAAVAHGRVAAGVLVPAVQLRLAAAGPRDISSILVLLSRVSALAPSLPPHCTAGFSSCSP